MASNYKISMPNANQVISNFGLGAGGKIQKFFTNELAKVSDGYVPMLDKALKNSVRQADDGTFIEYRTPYARYHWHGKVMIYNNGTLPKIVTDKDMVYNHAPNRGPKWVERAYADYGEQLIEAVNKKIKEGG